MRSIRLFESGGELPEEKVAALIAYLAKADMLDVKSLDFTESEDEYDLILITPFGRVKFEANGESTDHEYEGEGYWNGTEEFWRRLGDTDYFVLTSAVYKGRDPDDLTYVESKSIIKVFSKPLITNKN